MGRYKREIRELVDVNVKPGDLVTLAQAAEMLKVSVQAVAGAVDGGSFETVVIDTEVPERRGARGRRLLLRVEVMERALG